MLKIYTAGYMAGRGSERPDWREQLVEAVYGTPCDLGGTRDERWDIKWLHPGVPKGAIPGQGDSRIYMARDLAQINSADVLVALFNLEYARCLGAASEIGIAFQQRKPIILIDQSPDVGSLDFARAIATSVWPDIKSASRAIRFLAEGM